MIVLTDCPTEEGRGMGYFAGGGKEVGNGQVCAVGG